MLLLGESKPEAPAQEERRPTAPGELIQAKRSTFFTSSYSGSAGYESGELVAKL